MNSIQKSMAVYNNVSLLLTRTANRALCNRTLMTSAYQRNVRRAQHAISNDSIPLEYR